MFGQGSLDKEVWFEEAKRAYEEFSNKRGRRGSGLGTFDELEEQAVEAGDRLARFLIENSISAQSTDFDPPEECDCPRCGKPAKRISLRTLGGYVSNSYDIRPGSQMTCVSSSDRG